jgi:hypothetical protein
MRAASDETQDPYGTQRAPRTGMRIMIVLLAACATTAPPTRGNNPRGMRASDHLEAARQHDEQARERQRWPSTTTMTPGGMDMPVPGAWFRSWDTEAEHERMAATHRSKASDIESAYEEACGTRPLTEVSHSPFQRFGTGGWNTSSGVIVYLTPKAGTPEELLAALNCHRAWMMLAPANMDDCPLDLPGLQIDARGNGEGITLSLSVRDPKLIPELQRRVAHDLEPKAHRGAAD